MTQATKWDMISHEKVSIYGGKYDSGYTVQHDKS